MDDDYSLWAGICATCLTPHERITWFMTRIRHLERLEQALRVSGYEFLCGRAPYTLQDVEQAARRVAEQAEFIAGHLRALDRLRSG